jgi:hypothetical protein
MNISPDKLQEFISLYLNDVEDYNLRELSLTESAFLPIKSLILESKNKISLNEVYNNSPEKYKPIIKDFILYLENL